MLMIITFAVVCLCRWGGGGGGFSKMALNAEQETVISQMFEAYISEYHQDDMAKLLAASSDDVHRPVVINAMTLFEANMEIGDYFNAYPNEVLTIFDKVLHKTATALSGNASAKRLDGLRPRQPQMNRTLHARITGLPVCPELTRDTIPRSRDVGHFLSVTGTVIRTSVAKVLEYGRDYMCAKCSHVFVLRADFEQFYAFVPPAACPNPDGCHSCKFSCLSGGSEPAACRDYQEIKIQEQVQRLSVGSIPRSMVVVLEDDLVDCCKSGDDVTVYGVMRQRWKAFQEGARCDVELVLKANNVEVNNQQGAASLLIEDVQKEFKDFWEHHKCDPIAGRNQILLSLCPQVFGMYVIKLAVAMVLAGGVQRIDSSGTKTRGECHLLLVGDPGTGKSQFLKYAAKMMPRSVLTAGIGSTSAGLTVAAVKDGGDWHLEAGALVLSDGGLCCIDEFNSIKEHDRISIHEAMEQQSISVAKAGMVCKLNTRTTILAATNPKSQYDPKEALSVNIALASPLLSRFDLVLVLLDNRNSDWDRIISSFVLEDRGLPCEGSTLWPMEKMKAYFCVIKRLQPQVSAEANSILSRYYQLQRRSEGRNAARTTIRMLESLSRLAEAHARLMYRETVTIEDAVVAVSVMECSMQGGGLLGSVNAVLTSFPDDPRQEYRTQCQVLLGGLELPDLLQKEMDRLDGLGSSTVEASSSEQPTDGRLPHPGEPDAMTAAPSDVLDVSASGAELESGLDWFYSMAPSPTSDEISSAVFTSTQLDADRKTDSAVGANTEPAVTVTAEEGAQENLRAPDGQGAEPPGSAIQKISPKRPERSVQEDPIRSKPQFGTATKPTGALLADTTAAAPDENIPFRFSDFVFKPKKMTSKLNGGNGPNVQQKVGGNDEAKGALPRNDGGKNKRREKQPSFQGASVKKQVSRVSDKTTSSFPPEELQKDQSPRAQTAGAIGQKPDMGSQETLTPLRATCGTAKFAVTPSTIAKLSRFSFGGAAEPRRPAFQAHLEKNQQMEKVSREKECAELSRSASDRTTEQRPKRTPEVKAASRHPPPLQRGPAACASVKLTQASPSGTRGVKMGQGRAAAFPNCVKMKRKRLESATPASVSKGVLVKTSLFGSGDLNDDILDTDWDKEVAKKAKV
ncbi:DNA helicase MCM9 [Hippocampus zosterae]|uniref:DNA helicase MCM9 n=1 Tax=Hippocampus zosterae TaxID=109293 RepID=UPI00223CF9C5|nr:DNA helicase MCM9 [Hippocampus zosterae]